MDMNVQDLNEPKPEIQNLSRLELKWNSLSEEDRDRLKRVMFTKCGDYEPWADLMMLGGAGDGGVDHFPLDLFSEEIETITITRQGKEVP